MTAIELSTAIHFVLGGMAFGLLGGFVLGTFFGRATVQAECAVNTCPNLRKEWEE